ncbi:SDR family NAD(P)-dependent oxidoreductase, partial [Luteibacter sp. UNCMF366Tsu5.1]|uniref:SDR family NAD(P)-dependent oxidoreductase n=1 Tax=Luteibacter sp. UNCMF366Tsu5.1 TaxID=1502758 RepID=UPI0009085E90
MLDPARCIVAFLAAPLRDALQAGRAPDGARPVLDGLGLGAWIDDGTAPVTSFYGADATTRADLVARWHAITSSDAPCTHALAVLAAATLHETGASTVEPSLAALPPDVANALRHVMAVAGWDVADASSLIFSSRMTAAVACRGGLLACATGDVAKAAASLDAYALRLAATGMVPPEAAEAVETDAPAAAHAHAAPATPLGALVAMLDAAAGRQPSTAAEVLESAGARGYYDEGDRLPYAEGAPLFGAYRWARHASRVRRATLADLPRLLELEHLCWDHTRSDETVLRRRIDTYPAGQFVIEIDGAVAGCVYSQRIVTTDALTTVTAHDVHTLHRADGGLVQLLAINIDPRWQDQRLGDRLLEFLLRLATVTEGVEGVVGVTLCKRFDGASQDDFDTYVHRDGTGQDPVLAFHQAHGASIVRAIPGYRPDDAVNRTNGVLVAYDLVDRLARIRAARPSGSAPHAGASGRDLARWVGQRVKALLGNDSAAYAAERPLMEMGVDSAGLLALQRDLEGALGCALPGAFFFEHNTVARIAAALGIRDVAPAPKVTAPTRKAAPLDVRAGDIAIVGVACRLPGGVASPDALWKALDEGTNLIGSYPASRGRWASPSRYPGIDRGGFVTDIEAFDAAFFRISPAEARLMDPQQRLVLELAWQSLEDAGVVPASLAGRDVGVFVGASNADYSRLLQEQGEDAEAHLGVASSLAVIANRVSYFFDLGGPSLLLDTACSSSLVALHTAVQSLRRGECSSALVAGVNVICHPDLSVAYHKAGMLSPDGLCKVFDARADGYVRAEGAVAMYLKPLADALADGDPVQGVVRGTAINHGGLASGLTVPNPRKQRDLLLAAWRDADIDASAIGYLEAHGTGTSLGDPIEVEAIRGARAAAGLAGSTAPCGIGSLKSQLGHLESAAGLAGVLKVVLALRHDHVPATLHFNHLNPKIQLTDGLRVQSPAAPWPDGPRIAGVSSFGSGGANAHAVIAAHPDTMAAEPSEGPHLFVLSAHDPERLRVAVARAVDWLEGDGRHAPFAAAIRTWQCGRTALPHRIALRVERREQLVERLRAWLAGAVQVDDLWSGDTSGAIDGLDMWRTPAAQALIAHAAREGDLTQLATLWTRGVPVDWSPLHASRHRIAGLPSYPFARDRHWIDAASDGLVSAAGLHPMLHVNVSGLSGAAYTSSFRGSEPFLADHRVRIGDRVDPVLPAVAYVEMMCAAFERATPPAERGSGIALTHVAWMAPLIVRSPAQVHVVLSVDDAGSVRCDIASGDEARVPHGVGHLAWASDDTPEAVDLAALRARLDDALDAGSLYARLEELGLIYGPAHRALARLRQGRDEVLAELVLPPSLLATAGAYRLHPSLADAALQACLGLQGGSDAEPRLPFSVEHAWIRCDDFRLPSVAWIRRAGEGDDRIDIDLCADDGTVVAAWRGFSTRRIVAPATPRVQIGASTWQAIVDEAPALPWQRRVRLTLGTRAWPSATRLAVEPTDVVAVVTACLAKIQASFATRDAEPCLFQIGIDEGSALGDGLAAMFRTIAREEPRWHGQVLVAPASVDGDAFSAWADAMAARPGLKLVRWKAHGLGETPAWNFMPGVPDGVPYREHGVYLVTGGLGGIGSLVATDILSRAAHARVVLGGRGALEGERVVRFERLRRRFGERIDYRSMDLADDTDVATAIASIVASHGALHGVFHAAGTTRDAFVRGKSLDDIAAVLAPKVAGTLSLDAATARLTLDTFVCFSSTTAALGQVGQADYAAANGFMDGFARLRNMRVAAGERHGRTLSIAWPLWKDGGMRMDDVARREWQKATGMLPLGTDDGLRALRALLLSGIEHGIVMSGRVDALQRTLDATRKVAPATLPRDAQTIAAPASAGDDLRAAVETWLRGELARVLKTPADRVQASAAFETFGMDSILAMALTGALEKTTGPLPKTLLFEYRNLSELAGYLMTSHADSLTARFAVKPAQRAVASVAARTLPAPTAKLPALAHRGQARGAEPIAIVGISGRYPGAPDLATFWTNLRDGVDSIVEVPADRWDWRQYYSDDRTTAGRHYSRWGGFIEGVDEFDPQFFSIAPREARFIDPQERMFLQHAWMAVEDAGYTRATLRGGDEEAGRVGVYVGVMYSEYQLFGVRAQPESLRMGFAGNVASIANRVSYVLDLHGPSMTVDTMCSSSLTAIHLACQDLRSGATRMAIAGGVNLTVHPHKYLMLSAGQFISSDGHCQSFGEGGDGYIPGEGVGAVVLKRLADAERDGDVIHGVIRGSALNHGGRTNGYTVPNPQAQAAAIERALTEAGVDVRRIGYVEAHGTGTRLGDPIEI